MDNVVGHDRRDSTMSCGCRTVYGFATAIQHGRAAIDHLADMFVPLYMWRAAAFMAETAPEPPAAVQARLDALCDDVPTVEAGARRQLVGRKVRSR